MSRMKMKINPILKKEIRLGSRSIKLPLAIMFYNLLLAFIAIVTIAICTSIATYGGGSMNYTTLLSLFPVIGCTQMGIILLIVPIITAGSISGEREKQTLDIMLTTPVKPLSIVWGKLLASLSQIIMFVVSSIPIMAIAFILGGLNWIVLLEFIIMVCFISLFIGCIGVFCSSTFKKTIVSIVMTLLFEGLFFLLPVIIFFVAMAIATSIQYAMNPNLVRINFGILPMIMIENPLVAFFDFMLRAMNVSSLSELLKDSDSFGKLMPIIAKAWIPMSIVVNALIGYGFLLLAAKKINPIRKTKKMGQPRMLPVQPGQPPIAPVQSGQSMQSQNKMNQ